MVFPLLMLASVLCGSALVNPAEMKALKKSPLAPKMRAFADRDLKAGPWSVTYERPAGLDVDAHEYYSEAPYWWPDPARPGGPYIRRDGETNPHRFTGNQRQLGRMSEAVLALGMAAYQFDEQRYANRAAEVIRVFFLDEKTRMFPDFEYSQAVRGRNTGRGSGIISSRSLIWAAEGMVFLAASGYWSEKDHAAAQAWFADYLRWMTTSSKGREEAGSGNNHESWWTAQAAAYASFTGNDTVLRDQWRHYRERLVRQLQPDGSAPREEARTKSLSYSAFNLDALALLCRMGSTRGENLWRPLEPAVKYLAPYLRDPVSWNKPQIERFDAGRTFFLGLAGAGLGRRDWLARYLASATPDSPSLLYVRMMVE